MKQYPTVHDAVREESRQGVSGDQDFQPTAHLYGKTPFVPTDAAPGTNEKIEVLRRRVATGLPLWHDHDRKDLSTFSPDRVASRRGRGSVY